MIVEAELGMKLNIKKVRKYVFSVSVEAEQEASEVQQEQPGEAIDSGNFKFWKVMTKDYSR